MFYPYTERQRRFLAVVAGLADEFALRAGDQDRAGAFPHGNFAAIRRAGLPALVVPEEFGGWGADLLETVMAMERLAVGDGSTALSLTMHMQTLGNAAEEGSWPPELFARICRDAVERGALINACATEPEMGSPSRGGKPRTKAEPLGRDGAGQAVTWRITGRKSYASMAPVLDYFIIPATLEDGSEEVGRFVVPRGEGIAMVETWDAMGMRTTGSHDVILDQVCVPAGNMVARTGQSTGGSANAWFQLAVSAVYVGVGQAALQAAANYAQERVPSALGRPIATLESIQRHLGQAELLLLQARQALYHTAELWMRCPAARVSLSPMVSAAKVTATNHAVSAVDHCLRAAGGAGLTRSLPLERHYRDVRAGLSHPMSDDEAYRMLGRQLLAASAPGG
jgi:alkylation response protein AidB-like acyl-CoA dehydrogenase